MARKSRKNIDTTTVEPTMADVYYNAGAYVRLSTDDKKKRGDSLETQRNIIENFIAAAPDIRLHDIYTDNNATGTNFERQGFQKMLMDAESGKINCIIVKDLTRFGRNAIDAGYYLERYLPSLGVRFIAVTDGFDTNEGDGGILLPLKNIINESYALDIGRKCRAVQQQHINDGRFVGRMAPFGYSKAEDDCRRLVIDDYAADVVRQMFDWASQGRSMCEIVRNLNNANVLTPGRYKQANGISTNGNTTDGEYWQERKVRKILNNKVYTGDMVQGKTRKVNGKQFDISPDEWICVPDTHEPIVSRELFEQVQEVMRQVSEQDKMNRSEALPYTPHMFKLKVYCAECDRAMHRHRQGWNGVYWYRCRTLWKFAKDACVPVSVREEEMKEAVITLLHKQAEAILGRYVCIENANSKEEQEKYESELREINKNLDKDGRMLRSLYESMVSGVITPDEFVSMKADYEAKISALSKRADEIRNTQRDTENRLEEYRDMADAVSALGESDSLTSEIIKSLVDKILVRPDKSFEIRLRYDDEFEGVSA